MQIPKVLVTNESAAGFAQVWRHNGLAIALDAVHVQFATDFANTVLNSFVEMIQAHINAQEAAIKAAAETPQAQSVVLTGE